MNLLEGSAPTTAMAVERYEIIQPRLPNANFPASSIHRAHLGELVDEIDCFVLDGFGVLNVGDSTVPGAVDRVNNLREMGKQIRVLTNGATFPSTVTVAKYRAWGLQFDDVEVISSRDALARELTKHGKLRWGFVAVEESQLHTLVDDGVVLEDDESVYAGCDGFVLLGTRIWNAHRHSLLARSLVNRPRPVLVGNPDLVAPQVGELSREPGMYAHALQDEGIATPQFFGKPFDNAFAIVRESLEGIDPKRIAMVGDTLHTDILGGAQAGWKTVLVTGHGLLRNLDVEAAISRSGIRPDYIVPTT
ncbi:MAG: HAD-IIA family hydrolase [Granulosicoccus sp.]